MSSRYPGFGSRQDDNESKEDFVTIGTHFDPAEPTNSTSIVATLGRKASKLVDLSSSTYGYDGKRFHGAFTGGFNAGFYNTVGSVEGWRPSEFKSSRADRAEKRSYEPEDFMDKGDFSEHGINPKQIKIRNTFDHNEALTRSTHKQPSGSSNQRSNEDILRDMIQIKSLSIGKKILMSMGWKPGEGVGAKMFRKQRQKLKWSLTQETPKELPPSPPPPRADQQETSGAKVYGVAMPPPSFQHTLTKTSRLDDDDDEYFDNQIYANVSLPPLDYEVHFQLQKHDHHGLGYKGLESLNAFTHTNLFVQPSVEKQINNVKIRGQAFGVGMDEDEDDRDLFAQDDLKQYDYELTSGNDNTTDIMRLKTQENSFELKFVRYESMSMPVFYTAPPIPTTFKVGHRFPKSAMPLPPTTLPPSDDKLNQAPSKQPSIQHDANTRGLLLGDLSFLSRPPPNINTPPAVPPPPKPEEQTKPVNIIAPVPTPATSLEWDIEKERSAHSTPMPKNNARTQFLDAVKNRFTSSSSGQNIVEQQSMEEALASDLKQAVSLNLYGELTRSVREWKPNPLLCKRMNIPNPFPDDAYEDTKESKKSRRQLCSNLFEHLFSTSTNEPIPPAPSMTLSNDVIQMPLPPPSAVTPSIILPPKPPAHKPESAPIESFQEEVRERPPLDFFSAIFDNQDSEDEDADEPDVEEKKTDEVSKPTNNNSSIQSGPPNITIPPASFNRQESRDDDDSNSSDSSIEEIEIPGKSSLAYGPVIPTNLPSRITSTNDKTIWDKLADPNLKFEELKQKKKQKKKKKHHKKSKKHHH